MHVCARPITPSPSPPSPPSLLYTSLTHPNSHEELVDADGAAAITVEVGKELAGLQVSYLERALAQPLLELHQVQSLAAVVIHYAELALQTNQATSTTGFELLAEDVQVLLHTHVLLRDQAAHL